MLNRAYSILDVKAVDESARTIRGLATTPAVDRVGDIIDPLGVKFENPLPFLWQHFHDAPIGTVEFEQPTKNGVKFTARLPLIEEAGSLRDRIEEAWQTIKAGLVRAVSIGFRPLEYAFIDNGGIRYDEIEVYELSAVTIPANPEALISSVKSWDAALRHAAGVPEPEIPQRQMTSGQDNIALGCRAGSFLVTGSATNLIQPEIPSPPEPAAIGKTARIVRLNTPPASRQPFIIREIRRT
jgi:HK97 family phage prohead protease